MGDCRMKRKIMLLFGILVVLLPGCNSSHQDSLPEITPPDSGYVEEISEETERPTIEKGSVAEEFQWEEQTATWARETEGQLVERDQEQEKTEQMLPEPVVTEPGENRDQSLKHSVNGVLLWEIIFVDREDFFNQYPGTAFPKWDTGALNGQDYLLGTNADGMVMLRVYGTEPDPKSQSMIQGHVGEYCTESVNGFCMAEPYYVAESAEASAAQEYEKMPMEEPENLPGEETGEMEEPEESSGQQEAETEDSEISTEPEPETEFPQSTPDS